MNIRQTIRNRIRIFNKYITNKLTRPLVGLPIGPFALVKHVGRRSGKSYETPIFVFRIRDGFMIVLTYGPNVDWLRNVQAEGRCEIVWHGKQYKLGKPESVDAKMALPDLPQPFRFTLRLAGTHDYVKLNSAA